MSDRIQIQPADGTWVVRAAGAVIGETSDALELVENGYDPVIYFPRGDIAMAFLDASDTATTCPHKGAASYYSIAAKSGALKDAAWSYEAPIDGAAQIKDYLAFSHEKLAIEQL